MASVKIKIQNYRCFGWEPQEIELGKGFSALIGLNNSGKSATLKMFFELRNLWDVLSTNRLLRNNQLTISLNGISDTEEIFNNYNKNNILLTFIFENIQESTFSFNVKIKKEDTSHVLVSVEKTIFESNEISINGGDSNLLYYIRNDKSKSGPINVFPIYDFFKKLKNSIYIPSFRNIVNTGEKYNYYDISTGNAFIKEWDDWKAGNIIFNRDQIIRITGDIKNLFNYKDLEITPSVDKTTLRLTINGKPYSLHEIGSGLAQFILTFASAAIKKPPFIFIDEPELNLHPSLQLKFLTSLAFYASEGIFFATHSIGLARSSAEKIYSITNDGKESKIKNFGDDPNYLTLLGELSFSTYKEIGVNSLFFVEGPTDIKTMQEFLRKFQKDSKVLIMNLGGASMINGKREQELSEITERMNIKNIYAWIDSEKKSNTEELSKNRNDFLEVCHRLGIEVKASDRRATENYFCDRAIKSTFNDQSKKSLGNYDLLCEEKNWSKEDNWKIAKETTKEEIEDTDLGIFIKEIDC